MSQPETPFRVLIPDSLPRKGLQPLHDEGIKVDLQFKLPQDRLAEVIGTYDAVIVRSRTKIRAIDLENPGRLQLIARAGTGVDNIDVPTATRLGITVINTPDANTISAAELTMGHMIALARHIPQAYKSLKDENRWERDELVGTEVSGKVLGVIGAGNIGQEVIRRALAFGMKIRVFDKDPIKMEQASLLGAEPASFEEVLGTSDFVSLHIPLIEDTRHIIDESALAIFKEGAFLINVARGGLVDEAALVKAIKSGKLAGAALDVFETEPKVSEEILKCENIIYTPHLGASTHEAQMGVAYDSAIGVCDALNGELPRGAVNLAGITPEAYRQLRPLLPVAEKIAELALLLSERQRIQTVQISFLGEISKFDTRPLLNALVHSLVDPSSRQVVNLVNYREFDNIRGQSFPISEIKQRANGAFSSIRVSLIHEDGETSVEGINEHGPKVTEIDGYPLVFPVGEDKPMLFVRNPDKPGMLNQVSAALWRYNINVGTWCGGAHLSGGGSAMMQYSLNRALEEEELKAIRDIKGISLAIQVKI